MPVIARRPPHAASAAVYTAAAAPATPGVAGHRAAAAPGRRGGRIARADGPAAVGRLRAFAAATASLIMIFVASSSPVPIYNIYRAENGITNADLSLSVVAYFAGTILALVCLGRLVNHLGRKPVSLATLAIMALGCLVLIHVTGLGALALGRFIMGVAAGLASSSLTTYIVDAAPPRPSWLASVASSQSSQVGLTLGSLVSGAIVQTVAGARTVSYVVMISLLALCALALLTAPETGRRAPGGLASLRPRVGVPVHVRPRLPAAGTAFVVTWAVGGLLPVLHPLDHRGAARFHQRRRHRPRLQRLHAARRLRGAAGRAPPRRAGPEDRHRGLAGRPVGGTGEPGGRERRRLHRIHGARGRGSGRRRGRLDALAPARGDPYGQGAGDEHNLSHQLRGRDDGEPGGRSAEQGPRHRADRHGLRRPRRSRRGDRVGPRRRARLPAPCASVVAAGRTGQRLCNGTRCAPPPLLHPFRLYGRGGSA